MNDEHIPYAGSDQAPMNQGDGPGQYELAWSPEVRERLIQRFAAWLDEVMEQESVPEGIAQDVLDELEWGYAASEDETTQVKDGLHGDLYSMWSALTALTQETKLEGRAFKELKDHLDTQFQKRLSQAVEQSAHVQRELLPEVQALAGRVAELAGQREEALRSEARERTRREMLDTVLEVMDRLEWGLASARKQRVSEAHELAGRGLRRWLRRKKEGAPEGTTSEPFQERITALERGYELGIERLKELLAAWDIEPIPSDGEAFNPRVMRAADMRETDEVPEGTVLETIRRGYLRAGEVYRPAEVAVSRRKKKDVDSE